MFVEEIKVSLIKALREMESTSWRIGEIEIILEHPGDFKNGDYSSNLALALSKKLGKKPFDVATEIVNKWKENGLPEFIEKVEVAGIGFINIWLKLSALGNLLSEIGEKGGAFGKMTNLANKKIMVEFSHPNTHKELHIGHMRTLITGEALSRILTSDGAEVFRANYQGDIGPHVAKAIWGTKKLLGERGLTWEQVEEMTLAEKAHLLGEGYVVGSKSYETSKEEIDALNTQLYNNDPEITLIYERTRRWSLEYYQSFYERFGTKFDHLFFESEIAKEGKRIVEENVGRVFEKSEGAIIFDGEKCGLHKRVFVTTDGNPTYEGKEMALAYVQFSAFPFDKNIHVVANEQAGYFKVVIKALEVLDPKFTDKEFHLSMGMVNLVGKKMSSRTGEIFKVDDLLDEVKDLILPLIKSEVLSKEEKENIAEVLTIAAIKYSVLRVGPTNNVIFDIEKSVSLEGDSGPYIEYTFARTQSVLAKSSHPESASWRTKDPDRVTDAQRDSSRAELLQNDTSTEEQVLLRTLYRFPEVVSEAAKVYGPNVVCSYLFELSQKFNSFYDKQRIIGNENESFRLLLTAAVGQVLKNGLNLLGIEALSKM